MARTGFAADAGAGRSLFFVGAEGGRWEIGVRPGGVDVEAAMAITEDLVGHCETPGRWTFGAVRTTLSFACSTTVR